MVLVRVSFAADAAPGRTEASRPGGARPAGRDAIVGEPAAHPGDITVTSEILSTPRRDARVSRRGRTPTGSPK